MRREDGKPVMFMAMGRSYLWKLSLQHMGDILNHNSFFNSFEIRSLASRLRLYSP